MADLIDRQAAIEAVRSYYDECDTSDKSIEERIEDLPSAQPQACDDAISRDDAIMAVKTGALSAATIFGRTDEGATAYYETVKAIKALPSAQPQRKKGKWITVNGRFGDEVECNQCRSVFWYWMGNFKFCPNCGADMRGE